jgi:hypothetical protein
MHKVRLRRLLEELINGDLVQLDIEEDEESPPDDRSPPVKRLNLVARYFPE